MVTVQTFPEEILLRFDEAGAFKAAHQVRRRVTTYDDGSVAAELLPAEAIDPGGFAAIMGEAAAAAAASAAANLAQVAALTEALDLMEAERDEARTIAVTAVATSEVAVRMGQEAEAAAADLRHQLATALAEAAALRAQLAPTEP